MFDVIEGDYEKSTSHMTEWERSQEKEEFGRASQLYRPMSSLMASRFTQAKYKDEDEVIVNKEQGVSSCVMHNTGNHQLSWLTKLNSY